MQTVSSLWSRTSTFPESSGRNLAAASLLFYDGRMDASTRANAALREADFSDSDSFPRSLEDGVTTTTTTL